MLPIIYLGYQLSLLMFLQKHKEVTSTIKQALYLCLWSLLTCCLSGAPLLGSTLETGVENTAMRWSSEQLAFVSTNIASF